MKTYPYEIRYYAFTGRKPIKEILVTRIKRHPDKPTMKIDETIEYTGRNFRSIREACNAMVKRNCQ